MLRVPQIKLSVKYSHEVLQSELRQVSTSKEAYEVLKNCFDDDTFFLQEQFIILLLNQSNKIIGFHPLSAGGITSTVVDLRLIFATAIKSLATGIILAHNHPSGNLKASEADKHITKKIKQAGDLLDIKLIDHLIITSESYLSFADECLL